MAHNGRDTHIMRARRALFALVLPLRVLAQGSAASAPQHQADPPRFDAFFELTDSLVLNGTTTSPLVSVSDPLVMRDRIVMADYLGNRLLEFDRHGRLLRATGRKGDGPGEFQFPYSLAADASGHIYVNDRANSRIQVLDDQLRYIKEYEIDGTGDQVFVVNSSGKPEVVVQGMTRCDDPVACLVTDISMDTGNERGFAAPESDAPIATWRATIGKDRRVYLANALGDSVRVYSLAGRKEGAFELRAPSRDVPYGLKRASSRKEIGATLLRLKQERYNELSRLTAVDDLVLAQFERVNPVHGEVTTLIDVYTNTGCRIAAGVPTPGLFTTDGNGNNYFVSRTEAGTGSVTIRLARIKPTLLRTCGALGGV